MKKVSAKLRIIHIPQIGTNKSFKVDVANEAEAAKIIKTLAMQHLWLFENNFIPDFANIITVEMFNENEQEWEQYWNDDECMEWDELENEYFADI